MSQKGGTQFYSRRTQAILFTPAWWLTTEVFGNEQDREDWKKGRPSREPNKSNQVVPNIFAIRCPVVHLSSLVLQFFRGLSACTIQLGFPLHSPTLPFHYYYRLYTLTPTGVHILLFVYARLFPTWSVIILCFGRIISFYSLLSILRLTSVPSLHQALLEYEMRTRMNATDSHQRRREVTSLRKCNITGKIVV